MSVEAQQPAILIVEDQGLMRAVLRYFVQTAFPNCAIREAPDGATALKECAGQPPRIVLMDISLPDANGIELTARIRAMIPRVAVIVVSYHSGQTCFEQAVAAGACAYVVKDRLLPDLIPAVTDALGIAPAAQER